MTNKFQRYEAAVKLNTGQVVQYHNINTGLFKFHRFICEKFSEYQKWIYYSVRRKENKEDIGMFFNQIEGKEVTCIKIEVQHQESKTGNGRVFFLPFIVKGKEIVRNLFIVRHQIIEEKKDYLCITKRLFNKMIKEAKANIVKYYSNRNETIEEEEISLGDFLHQEFTFFREGKQGTYPLQDYP